MGTYSLANYWAALEWETWFGPEGGTTTHMQSVQASHDWNMEYGKGDLTSEQWYEYITHMEDESWALIESGQNESEQAVRRYWEAAEAKLKELDSPKAQAAAAAGVTAAKAHEDRARGGTEKTEFRLPWWAVGAVGLLLFWKK